MSYYYNMYRMYTDIARSSQNKNKVTVATLMNLSGHKSERRRGFMSSA